MRWVRYILKLAGQFAIILAFYGAGVAINHLTNGVAPASITGMILLFVALLVGVVKSAWIDEIAQLITRYMIFFFLPTAVGIAASWGIISENLAAILASVLITTVLVIVVVGVVQQKLGKRW